MGKYIRKSKGSKAVGEMTVMEVTQVVGVRTRSRAIKAASMAKTSLKKEAEVELQGYLELRSRRLFMTPRIARPAVNSASRRCNISKMDASSGRLSRCSSTSSFAGVISDKDGAECSNFRSRDAEVANDQESSVGNCECNRERRDMAPSSESKGEMSDLESESGEKSRCRSHVDRMPSQTEIDDFFGVAEKAIRDRFASKYNFDVEREMPLEGRYEWVQLNC
ncbi:Cyclin-dependent kinase inhibitor family protein [Rhynchospora pubera]|uniref:Cyclin-dependent kinase inhibitor n=1 Tax=Rhynchospora pubera TaxID=906938 RepID=A0AAV8DED5_9POAL|nr:Cyclin-dependent kinase inhibitor family protein [Rhynchospora pubera]